MTPEQLLKHPGVSGCADLAIDLARDFAEAERILLDCATQYYVASGLVKIDGEDGYGPLRAARVFIEAHGSDAAKAELARWSRG